VACVEATHLKHSSLLLNNITRFSSTLGLKICICPITDEKLLDKAKYHELVMFRLKMVIDFIDLVCKRFLRLGAKA
jgi:hypothetical protein